MKPDASDIAVTSASPQLPADAQPQPGAGTPADTAKPAYDFEIDLGSENTHAVVVRWTGRDRRVLELGPATGYMSKAFRERGCSVVGIEVDPGMAELASRYCERVIVGDLDTLDLDTELGADRFDVIVAADVLEHLKEPLGALQRLRRYLVPDGGCFVVSLPNIAHGSVRLALLQGRFSYRDLGLLDRTHLRFFTRESIEQLFDDAELVITDLKRQQLNIDASEVQFDAAGIPAELLDEIAADPDARTYQFVLKAAPVEQPGMRVIQERMRVQAYEVAELREKLAVAQQQLESERREREAVAADAGLIARREGDLRTALVDAHDQLLRRDEELRRIVADLDRFEPLEAERRRLLEANAELHRAQSEAREIIAAKSDESRRLRVRLERIVNSPPVRLWYRVGRLPLIRRVVARRTADYLAAVDTDSGS